VTQVLTHVGLLKAIQEHIRFARARFGIYDTIDFVVVLLGYALSGERTLTAYYARLLIKWPWRLCEPSFSPIWWPERLSFLLGSCRIGWETTGGSWMSMPPNKPPANAPSHKSGAFLPLIVVSARSALPATRDASEEKS
jgi:hypothetical protein